MHHHCCTCSKCLVIFQRIYFESLFKLQNKTKQNWCTWIAIIAFQRLQLFVTPEGIRAFLIVLCLGAWLRHISGHFPKKLWLRWEGGEIHFFQLIYLIYVAEHIGITMHIIVKDFCWSLSQNRSTCLDLGWYNQM